MSEEGGPLVIVGDSAIAEVAYEYFEHDSLYEVVAFTVEKDFVRRDSLFGLPVVPFETIASRFAPRDHTMFVAVGYGRINRLRRDLIAAAEEKGYEFASYISSRAMVWHNVEVGPNAFILEGNVVQPFVRIGKGVTLWNGNHIGHHSEIGDYTFVSSHVVISGFVTIEDCCFLGVNSTIANNVTVQRDCLIGAGALVLRDTEAARIYAAKSTEARQVSTLKRFGIDEE